MVPDIKIKTSNVANNFKIKDVSEKYFKLHLMYFQRPKVDCYILDCQSISFTYLNYGWPYVQNQNL